MNLRGDAVDISYSVAPCSCRSGVGDTQESHVVMFRRLPVGYLACVVITIFLTSHMLASLLYAERVQSSHQRTSSQSQLCQLASSRCRQDGSSQLSRCVSALRQFNSMASVASSASDSLDSLWQTCGDTSAALRQLAQLRTNMKKGDTRTTGRGMRRLASIVRQVASADKPEARCYDALDLSSNYEQLSDSDHNVDDVLLRMKQCGHNPTLLSQSVESLPDDGPRRVPNVVHYIRFGTGMHFDFQQYLSFLGIHKFIKPQYIFIHGDSIPSGNWWNRTRTEVTNIYHVWMKPPSAIFGKPVGFVQHAADFVRIQLLLAYGGIYLDHDVLVVKSFDRLRHYDVTLGRELPSSLANGIIVARRGAPFLRLWLETYRSYDPHSWTGQSARTPHALGALMPHLVHVEERSLVRPNWQEEKLLYGGHYDWSANYCIHIYFSHRFVLPAAVDEIRSYNATLGEVMRFIYFGSSEMHKS